MQRDIQTEVVLCPNCDEEVPKTLYCLNCGYPLYKLELEQAEPEVSEAIKVEETPELVEPELTREPYVEEEVSPMAEITETTVESVLDVAKLEEEPEITPVDEPEEPAEVVELVEAVTVQGEVEAEVVQIQGPEDIEEDYGVEAEVTAIEEEPSESVEEAVVEVVEEITEAETEAVEEIPEETIIEEALEEQVHETLVDFEPDPIVTSVMEHLAKNISIRIKLVNLLRKGDVKEVTFNRLFESYAAQGERWMNRRNEMLERNRYDLDAMEKAFTEARNGLEELEIKKLIGDASEEEYLAKAKAYDWDISLLDKELQRRKCEIAYLEDLTRVMPAEEVQGLKEMTESCYDALDDLDESGRISSETVMRVKEAMEEALAYLKGSGCE